MGFGGSTVSDKLQDVNGGILGAHELQMPWLLRRNNWSKGAHAAPWTFKMVYVPVLSTESALNLTCLVTC